MKPLLFLVYAFINTFGITQPTPDGAKKAAGALGWLLLLLLVVLALFFALIRPHP